MLSSPSASLGEIPQTVTKERCAPTEGVPNLSISGSFISIGRQKTKSQPTHQSGMNQPLRQWIGPVFIGSWGSLRAQVAHPYQYTCLIITARLAIGDPSRI